MRQGRVELIIIILVIVVFLIQSGRIVLIAIILVVFLVFITMRTLTRTARARTPLIVEPVAIAAALGIVLEPRIDQRVRTKLLVVRETPQRVGRRLR